MPPLDVFVVRKVGAPHHREFGVGAVAEGGATVSDEETLRLLNIDEAHFARLVAGEQIEWARRIDRYRSARALPPLVDRDVVLIDDGLATGVTAHAAIVAVMVGSLDRCAGRRGGSARGRSEQWDHLAGFGVPPNSTISVPATTGRLLTATFGGEHLATAA